jgi:hypothetical protein
MNYNNPESDSTKTKKPSNAEVFEAFKKEGLNTGDSTPKPTVNKGGSLSGIADAATKVAKYAVFAGGNIEPIVNAGKQAFNYVSDKFKNLEDFQSTKQQISKGGGLNFNAGFEALPQDVQDKMDPEGKSDKAPVNYKQEPGKAPMLRNCGSSRYK